MFKRDVLIDGAVYGYHAVVAVSHSLGGSTHVTVRSYVGNPSAVMTRTNDRIIAFDLDDTMTIAAAEERVKENALYEEYIDPDAAMVEELSGMLTDEQAATVPSIYREWQVDTAYAAGDRRRHDGSLYRCLQAHTSQEGYEPDAAPSLWACILAGQDGTDIGVWEQPDSTNPYMTGDKVHYPTMDDPVYESTIDNNIWSPADYPQGWQLVEEAD